MNPVPCDCAARCFLEEDSARMRANPAGTWQNTTDSARWERLDDARLSQKGEWLERLGVSGVAQVRCRKFSPESEAGKDEAGKDYDHTR